MKIVTETPLMFKQSTMNEAIIEGIKGLASVSDSIVYDNIFTSDTRTGICSYNGSACKFRIIAKFHPNLHPNRRWEPTLQITNPIQ